MINQMQSSELDLVQQRKGRMVLLLMVVFFLVPVIVVLFMYKFNWKPTGDSYGTLVRPPQLLTVSNQLIDDSGKTLSALIWKDKWSLVYISDDCNQQCEAKLHDMRQLHASLYKDIVRVQKVWITNMEDTTKYQKDYPDLMIIHHPESEVNQLKHQFQANYENVGEANNLYLVDPLGYYMMQYAADTPLANVRKDLVKLLKSSWAG